MKSNVLFKIVEGDGAATFAHAACFRSRPLVAPPGSLATLIDGTAPDAVPSATDCVVCGRSVEEGARNPKREAIESLVNFTKLDAVFYYTAPFAAEATLYVVRLLSGGAVSTSHLAVESELVDVTACVHAILTPKADEDAPAYIRRVQDAVSGTPFLTPVRFSARSILTLRVPT